MVDSTEYELFQAMFPYTVTPWCWWCDGYSIRETAGTWRPCPFAALKGHGRVLDRSRWMSG